MKEITYNRLPQEALQGLAWLTSLLLGVGGLLLLFKYLIPTPLIMPRQSPSGRGSPNRPRRPSKSPQRQKSKDREEPDDISDTSAVRTHKTTCSAKEIEAMDKTAKENLALYLLCTIAESLQDIDRSLTRNQINVFTQPCAQGSTLY